MVSERLSCRIQAFSARWSTRYATAGKGTRRYTHFLTLAFPAVSCSENQPEMVAPRLCVDRPKALVAQWNGPKMQIPWICIWKAVPQRSVINSTTNTSMSPRHVARMGQQTFPKVEQGKTRLHSQVFYDHIVCLNLKYGQQPCRLLRGIWRSDNSPDTTKTLYLCD
jgi:hypothetical protein